jgi:hypothetical protein
MKKSIGLTADVSTFNTTLPQTRHLNYFMGTNPRRYASGGDVSQGIPNYPNPNVTNGFLPMALGFAPGGEVDNWDFIKNLLKKFDNDFTKLLKFLQNILNYSQEEAESIINKIKTSSGPSQEVFDREEEIKGLETPRKPLTPKDTVAPTPSDRQPGIGISNNMPPLVPSDRQGAFDNVPLQPLPKISIEQRQRDSEDKQRAPDTIPGITSIIPSDRQPGIETSNEMEPKEELPLYLKPFDLNGDGEVNIEDYNIAKETGSKYLDDIAKFLGIIVDKGADALGLNEDNLPKISKEQEDRDLEDEQKGITTIEKEKIKPKIKPPQDNITTDEQNTFKNSAEFFGKSNQEQMEIANKGGITALDPSKPDKTKKDVPAWALPMMSAGFAMMASKSPYFMQALGEAGQAGVETYSTQKTAEEDKLDKESTRNLQKAQADSYTNKVSGTPFVHSSGYLYRYRGDQAIPLLDEKGQKIRSIPTDAEITSALAKEMPVQWGTLSTEEKRKLIDERKNLLLGQIQTSLSNTEGGDSGDGSFWKDTITGILTGLGDKMGLKDGGIVSIRR